MQSSINIKHIPSIHYVEVGQKSPMKWCVLDVAEDGTAKGQHSWWKCKDFLNDSVVFLHTGKVFGIYGYQNKLTLNAGVAYVALRNIPEFFFDNLDFLNEWLVERDMEPITVHEHNSACCVDAVIGIDESYWESTFTISVITSLIRSCVYKPMKEDIMELFKEEPTLQGFLEKVTSAFVVDNRPLWKKLLYKNFQYDGTKLAATPTYTIHNAGLQSWINSGVFA